MKILKILFIAILSIIILLLIISFFLPSKMHVERSLVINAPTEIVFDQINTLKKWEQWSPWIKMDSTLKMTYEGPESGVGAAYRWVGNPKTTGSGKLTISESRPNELIVTDLDLGEGGTGTGGYKFEPADSGVKVTWYMDSEMGLNPVMRYMGVMMKGVMENLFDQGLNDIKKIAESMPPPAIKPEMTIESTTVKAQNYLAIRDTVSIATIGQKLGLYYGMIGEVMKKQNLNFAGQPFAIYHNDSQTNWDMDAAIPVDKAGKADGKVKPGEIKAGNAVVAHYFGAYEGLGLAHLKIDEWLTSNNKKATGAPWEVYVSDPGVEKDTAKWQTDVYYPIE